MGPNRKISAAIVLAAILISWGVRFHVHSSNIGIVVDGWTGEIVPGTMDLGLSHAKDLDYTFEGRKRTDTVSAILAIIAIGLLVVLLWPDAQPRKKMADQTKTAQ